MIGRLKLHLFGLVVLAIAIGVTLYMFDIRKPADSVRKATQAGHSGATPAIATAPRHVYPAEVVNRLLRACATRGSSVASCRCLLGSLEATVPLSDYERADALIRGRRSLPEDLRTKLNAALDRCR